MKCPMCEKGVLKLSRLPNFPAPDVCCMWCKGTAKVKDKKYWLSTIIKDKDYWDNIKK